MIILGVSKTLYNSAISILTLHQGISYLEVLLTERITRLKSSGNWPAQVLRKFDETYYKDNELYLLENRDVLSPALYEKMLGSVIPFEHSIGKQNLSAYLSENTGMEYVGHHLAHAYSAMAFSPYKRAIILVIDGAGSLISDLPQDSLNTLNVVEGDLDQELYEEYSIYCLDHYELECVDKKWQKFVPLQGYSKKVTYGIGISYEVVADFIFGSNQAAGKVMGLACFGTALDYQTPESLLKGLDWSKSFKGRTKEDWEGSEHLAYYKDVAATMQMLYEKHLDKIVTGISSKYSDFDSLIITGGSALNVVSNSKLLQDSSFQNIYIPPAPDDRGISVGLALKKYYEKGGVGNLTNFSYLNQSSSFGALSSVPCREEVENLFTNYSITVSDDIAQLAAKLLHEDKVIAIFSGRSEIGPRSLGNRSIIANPAIAKLKEYLNDKIKFRESFRPYGASCLYERRDSYFIYPEDHETPFMSFSMKVKSNYAKSLESVTHADGTCRVQTVRAEQNKAFYDIIHEFGKLSGLYCVLNTSLNIMGEPIVETICDLKKFLDQGPVNHAIIENMLITKNE